MPWGIKLVGEIEMADNHQDEVQSPCIGVCSMDDATGYCLGCYRTLDEIKAWWDMSSAEQQQLLAVLEARQHQTLNFD